MSYSCPVTFEKVDSNISRLSSFIVSLFVAYYLYSFNLYVLFFLFLDFFMRLFCQKRFSLIHLSSVGIKRIFRIKDKFSDGGAKKLAGMFGIFFILLLITLNQYEKISMVVGILFIICSLLDAAIDYCVGCKIYYIIKKIYPNFMS